MLESDWRLKEENGGRVGPEKLRRGGSDGRFSYMVMTGGTSVGRGTLLRGCGLRTLGLIDSIGVVRPLSGTD